MVYTTQKRLATSGIVYSCFNDSECGKSWKSLILVDEKGIPRSYLRQLPVSKVFLRSMGPLHISLKVKLRWTYLPQGANLDASKSITKSKVRIKDQRINHHIHHIHHRKLMKKEVWKTSFCGYPFGPIWMWPISLSEISLFVTKKWPHPTSLVRNLRMRTFCRHLGCQRVDQHSVGGSHHFQTPMGHPWDTHGTPMGHPWDTHGTPMGHPYSYFEVAIVYAC